MPGLKPIKFCNVRGYRLSVEGTTPCSGGSLLNSSTSFHPSESDLHADPCEPAALDARRQQIGRPELRRTGRDGRRVQQVVEIQRWFVRHTAALGAPERLSNTKIQLIR